MFQQFVELDAGLIGADGADDDGLQAEGCEVPGDVCRAAGHAGRAGLAQHGDGRFGGNTVDDAVYKAVEHDIADAQHPLAPRFVHDLAKAGRLHPALSLGFGAV